MSRIRSDRAGLGSRFDEFLRETGDHRVVTDAALKQVLAWQLEQSREEQGITKAALAAHMKTSRSQLDRLLDPTNSDVTLSALQRVAAALGRRIRLELTDESRAGAPPRGRKRATGPAKAAGKPAKQISPHAGKRG